MEEEKKEVLKKDLLQIFETYIPKEEEKKRMVKSREERIRERKRMEAEEYQNAKKIHSVQKLMEELDQVLQTKRVETKDM